MYPQHPPEPPRADGEYQPPAGFGQPRATQHGPGWRKAAGGTAVGLGFLALKFKTLLLVAFSFKWLFFIGKFALSFGTLFVSMWFYALLFGWPFAIIIIMLLLMHELGHFFAFRALNVPVSLPYFIPGFGAFVQTKQIPENAVHSVIGSLAGPVTGLVAAAACHVMGITTGNMFWYVAAYFGYFINALNLLPVPRFDGGQIAQIIEPRLWVLGLIAIVAYLTIVGFQRPITWLLLILFVIPGIMLTVRAWHGEVDPRAAAVAPSTKGILAVCYFTAMALAVYGAFVTQAIAP